MPRAREPHACTSAPPNVLANVTLMQSAREGAPLVSANAPSPAAANSTQPSRIATTVFSRRPHRSGSDSRRD